MGYNRSGKRRTEKQKRHKKLMQRLLAKESGETRAPTTDKTATPTK